jgi:tetratricopeptide (TPR) repeat protein
MDPRIAQAWQARHLHPRAAVETAASVLADHAATPSPCTVLWARMCLAYGALRDESPKAAADSIETAVALAFETRDPHAGFATQVAEAELAILRGEPDLAVDALSDLLANAPAGLPDADHADAVAALASALWAKGHWNESLDLALDAVALATQPGLLPMRPRLLLQLGRRLSQTGLSATALRFLQAALDAGSECDDPLFAQSIRAAMITARVAQHAAGEDAHAIADASRHADAVAALPALPTVPAAVAVLHAVAEARIAEGRLAAADEALSDAGVLASRVAASGGHIRQKSEREAVNLWLRGWMASVRAEHDLAVDLLTHAVWLLGTLPPSATTARAYVALADALAARGESEKSALYRRAAQKQLDARALLAPQVEERAARVLAG